MPDLNDRTVLRAPLQRLLDSTERRREPRYETDSVVIVHTLHPASAEAVKGKIVNVSAGGLALRLAKPLLPGMEVQVISGRLVIIGRIRFARVNDDSGFDHGVAIDQLVTLNMADSASQLLNLASQTATQGDRDASSTHPSTHESLVAQAG